MKPKKTDKSHSLLSDVCSLILSEGDAILMYHVLIVVIGILAHILVSMLKKGVIAVCQS